VSEINHRLDNLDLQPWQLQQLWDGQEVELTDWQSWPHRVDADTDSSQPKRSSRHH
jgi:hypothetical protein